MKQALITLLCLLPLPGVADNWALLAEDDASRTTLETSTLDRDDPGGIRFQLRQAYAKPRDMMGLRYDATQWRYVLSCASRQVLWRQQVLLRGDEVVWTFPESSEAVPAARELSDDVLRRVCS